MASDTPPLLFTPRFGALHPTNSAAREAVKALFPKARADTIDRLAKRFDRFVAVGRLDQCWPWTGYRRPTGYGVFSVGQTPVQATHIALLLAGHARPGAAAALHSCDNPPCCNPAHLRWGDGQDNADDREARGRSIKPKGEDHGQSKLTDAGVRHIRTSGKTLKALSEELGVSITVVSLARAGKTWGHVQ